MKINHGNINDLKDWKNIEDYGVMRMEGDTTASPEISLIESENAFGRKRLHSVNYTERKISVHILVAERTMEDMIKKREEIVRLFSKQFSMILSNDPDRVYQEVTLSSAVEVDRISHTAQLVKFDLIAYNPYRFGVDEKISSDDFNSPGNILVNNNGDYEANPVVAITGSGAEVNITNAGKTTTIVNLTEDEIIEVDSEKLTVVDTVTETSRLHKWRDNFIVIEPGANEIEISGDFENVKIEIKFRDTYL